MRTIALFGGSFDPPHLGHEAVVQALLKLREIDEVLIMPTYLNPFKSSSFAPAQMRLKWLKEIFSSLDRVKISSFEVEQNKKVPTIETVEYLLKSYQKVYLVIGADNLSSLKKWHRFDTLKKKVTFIVASRDDIDIPPEYIQLQVDQSISSTRLRSQIDTTKLCKVNAQEIAHYYKENNEK